MLPIESVADFSLNKKINFQTLDGQNFTINFLITDNVQQFSIIKILKVSASVCTYLNSKTGVKLIHAGSILSEKKLIGDIQIYFSPSPLLVIFIKVRNLILNIDVKTSNLRRKK
ncbi:hypothetical protein HZS_6383 [Henneguya salminicola]|nr:hypothetical protein HZS_6383 [Henneguya salminicola]